MKKIRNPLIKRLPREFTGDWKKYVVVAIFLVSIIGSVSGMHVANNSMLIAADEGIERYNREDGNFELEKKASPELLAAIEEGRQADLPKVFRDKGREELDKKFYGEFVKEFDPKFREEFDKAFDEQVRSQTKAMLTEAGLPDDQIDAAADDAVKEARSSGDYKNAYISAYKDAYKEAYDEAYDEALKEVDKEVEKEYKKAADKYELGTDNNVTKVRVYENNFVDVSENEDNKIRVFKIQDKVNRPSIFEGTLPSDDKGIAIDRMHADNAGLKIGDTVKVAGRELKITALIALPNYSCLYESNSDTMFDALKFDVGLVVPELWEEIAGKGNIRYSYAWVYDVRPEDDLKARDLSEDLLKVVISQALADDNKPEDFLPAYLNQAITFATSDFTKDLGMMTVFMDIYMVVIAFIFGVTISSTIAKEAKVIGTLRASGYTRGELIRHYMLVPMIVTVFAALVGNILGYTFLKDVVASMYYNSYSLPTFEVVWSPEAFYSTTVIPLIIIFAVNLIVISYKLRFTPLEFLRNDLKKTKRKNAMRLPRWKFLNRFRLRIVFQNIPNYLVLALGVIFIMFMMAFAIGAPDTIDKVKEGADEMIICDYQTVLKSLKDDDGNDIVTAVDSEKFGLESLRIKNDEINEDVMVYGIADGSGYVALPKLQKGEVVITGSLSEKYKIGVGDTFELEAKFEKSKYSFKAASVEDKFSPLSVFMPLDEFNRVFDKENDEFSGFFSDERLTDIDERYIAKVITINDIMKTVDQLDHSMGDSMLYFQVVCVILAAVLTYLLTKVIIDKSENSISMTKILGYSDSEISSLYITGTTIIFVLIEITGLFLGIALINVAWELILQSMSGWYVFYVSKLSMIKMLLLVFIGYLAVVLLDMRRIKKVPLEEALKNVE